MSKKITLLVLPVPSAPQSLDVIRAQGYEVFGLSATAMWRRSWSRSRSSTPGMSA